MDRVRGSLDLHKPNLVAAPERRGRDREERQLERELAELLKAEVASSLHADTVEQRAKPPPAESTRHACVIA